MLNVSYNIVKSSFLSSQDECEDMLFTDSEERECQLVEQAKSVQIRVPENIQFIPVESRDW